MDSVTSPSRSLGNRSRPSSWRPLVSQSASTPGVQSKTVRTLRGLKGEPLRDLPYRTLQTPNLPNWRACGLAARSTFCRCRSSLNRSPVGIRDLQHHGIPVGGLPALAAGAGDPFHLVVGMVEQLLQLASRVGALGGSALEFLDVHGGVPLEEHLHRVRPE